MRRPSIAASKAQCHHVWPGYGRIENRYSRQRKVPASGRVRSGAMVAGSLVGGWLVELSPGLPFALGAVMSSIGAVCSWRLCVRLDAAPGQACPSGVP